MSQMDTHSLTAEGVNMATRPNACCNTCNLKELDPPILNPTPSPSLYSYVTLFFLPFIPASLCIGYDETERWRGASYRTRHASILL